MRSLFSLIFLAFPFLAFAEVDPKILEVNKVPFVGNWQLEKLTYKGARYKDMPIEQALLGKKLAISKRGIKLEGQNCVSFHRSWVIAPKLYSSYKDEPNCKFTSEKILVKSLHISQIETEQKPKLQLAGYFLSDGEEHRFTSLQFSLSPLEPNAAATTEKVHIPKKLIGTYRILPPRGLESKSRSQLVFRKDVIGKNINIGAHSIQVLGHACDVSTLAYKSNIRDTKSESLYSKEKPFSNNNQYYNLTLNCPTPAQPRPKVSEHFQWLDSTLGNTSFTLHKNSNGDAELTYGPYYGGSDNYILQRIDKEDQITIADKMTGIWAMKPLPNGIANVVENTTEGLTKLYPFNCNKINAQPTDTIQLPKPEARFFRYSSEPNIFIIHSYDGEDKFKVNQVTEQNLSMTMKLRGKELTFNYKKVNKITPLCN